MPSKVSHKKKKKEKPEKKKINFMDWIKKVNIESPELNDCVDNDRLAALCPKHDDYTLLGKISGYSRLFSKKMNKGFAFTRDERLFFKINALLPHVIKTQAEQIEHCHILLDRIPNKLEKYYYLIDLSERQERLFYMVIRSNIKKILPIIYTPNVANACRYYSHNFLIPKGLFITYADKGHILSCLKQWPERCITTICVTDGERILGMGDLGVNGMPVPVSKCILFTAFAGVKPHNCLPITIDVGTNNKNLLNDPLYLGLKQKRISGNAYIAFMDEFMVAVQDCYGQSCVVQFEDFGKTNSLRLLSRYQEHFCCYNDDIQSSAAVIVAFILNSMKPSRNFYREQKLLFVGAGQAAIGAAKLFEMLLLYMGMKKEESKRSIWMFDSKGLVVRCRPSGGLDEHKLKYGHDHEPIDTLLEAIIQIRPTTLIGLSNTGGMFSPEVLEKMAEINSRPVILALSNPPEQAECTGDEAYKYTKGKCLFATGSSAPPVMYKGKQYFPSIVNDSIIFPGLALGVNAVGLTHIPNELFLLIARKIASLATDDEMKEGGLLPSVDRIAEISPLISATIMEYAFINKVAALKIEPQNKVLYLKAQMYNMNYSQLIPDYFYKHKHEMNSNTDEEETTLCKFS